MSHGWHHNLTMWGHIVSHGQVCSSLFLKKFVAHPEDTTCATDFFRTVTVTISSFCVSELLVCVQFDWNASFPREEWLISVGLFAIWLKHQIANKPTGSKNLIYWSRSTDLTPGPVRDWPVLIHIRSALPGQPTSCARRHKSVYKRYEHSDCCLTVEFLLETDTGVQWHFTPRTWTVTLDAAWH